MAKFERDVEIDAQVEKVWQVLTNTAYWPKWFPGIDSIANAGEVAPGGTFEWVDDGQTGRGEFLEVVPFKKLVVLTQIGNDKDKHTFELRPTGGFFGLAADECKVEYKLDTLRRWNSGPLHHRRQSKRRAAREESHHRAAQAG